MKARLQQVHIPKFVITFLLITMCSAKVSYAQEFLCEVSINTQRLANASFAYLNELKPALETYINEYEWTDDEFLEQERIECQMQIIFTSGNNDFTFSAEINISARRPIYNTIRKTSFILLNDEFWQFSYPQGSSLIHDDLLFDPLVSLIDFYCYIMLGLDYDSFALQGGNPLLNRAQNVLDLSQTTGALGWNRNSNNRRNRYFLITDLLNPSYEGYRRAIYMYNRLGLDTFTTNAINARQQVLLALRVIQDTKRTTTNNYLYDLFFDVKSKELASIFEDSDTQIRLEAYNILSQIDQSHLSDYESLQN